MVLSGLSNGDVKEITVKLVFAPDIPLCALTLPVDEKSKILLGNYQYNIFIFLNEKEK